MNQPLKRLLQAGAAIAVSALAACIHGAVKDPGADRVRTDLGQLEADPQLSSRAPQALKEAQDAVAAADTSQSDPALSAHLVYIADRKVQTARALAEARVAQDQLKILRAQQPDGGSGQ